MHPNSDFSFLGLFLNAHFVVQAVVIGLIMASVWCWSIVIEKYLAFSKARAQTDEFERIFWSGQSLDELYMAMSQKQPSAMGALFVAAMREWRRSIENTAKPLGRRADAHRARHGGHDHPRDGAA